MLSFIRRRQAAFVGASLALILAGCSDPEAGGLAEDDAGDAQVPPPDAHADATHGPDASADAATHDAARPDASVDAAADASGDARADADADATTDAGPLDSDGDGTIDPLDCAPTDPNRWMIEPYSYRDADGDSYTVAQSGTVCAGNTLPSGYATSANGDDCNDADPNLFRTVPLFADIDDDGFGAGTSQQTCVGAVIPAGQSLNGDDCAPAVAAAWQQLTYDYRDADGDSYTVGMSGQVCTGASLPKGYSATNANGNDCDDTNPLIWLLGTYYPDVDADGVGAGAAQMVCTNGTVPPGDSSSDTDCAPDDPTRWRMLPYAFVDRDGDGATVPETGSLCAGPTLPPPYYATAHGNDCDDTVAALTHWQIFYPDADGDGAGVLPYVIRCNDDTIPAGYSRYGDDEDDTKVSVGPLPPEDILDIVLP